MSSEIDIADPKLGTTVNDRYRLDERLAAGGMGVVYRGTDLERESPVAVKFVHEAFAMLPTLVKRFQREVAAMQRLKHPNLVAIVDSGVSGGVPYLVMDFHDGRSLSDVLERGTLPMKRVLSIARQILGGVGHAHLSGVVHRDLKPDNILLVDDEVKILDFGLAKMISEEGAGTQLTNTGFALGTPGYMAPEQARGIDTDARTDLYAIGVILYQMVTGKRPFVAESPMAVLRMHMDDPPLAPRRAAPDRKISGALESLILRALEKDPARRFQSAVDFEKALDATPEATGAPIESVRQFVAGARKRPRILAPWLVLAAVAVGGVLGWSRLSHHKQEDLKQTVQTAVKQTVDGPIKTAVSNVKETWKNVTAQPAPPVTKPPPPIKADDDDDDDGEATPPTDGPGARLEATSEPVREKRMPTVDEAARLLAAGKVDAAIQMLYHVRRQAPRSPAVGLLLGHAYFRKSWRSDGLREYDSALQLRPSLKHDKVLLHNLVSALNDPTSRLARTLLRRRVGSAALPELHRAARDSDNSKVQKRATKLAAELRRRR